MNEFIKHYSRSDFKASLCWLTHTHKKVPEEITLKYSKHLERHPLLRDSWRQRNVGRSTQGYYPKRGRSGTPSTPSTVSKLCRIDKVFPADPFSISIPKPPARNSNFVSNGHVVSSPKSLPLLRKIWSFEPFPIYKEKTWNTCTTLWNEVMLNLFCNVLNRCSYWYLCLWFIRDWSGYT